MKSCWAYLKEPVIVKMKNGEYYQIIAEDQYEFGRYLAENPLGETIIIREDDIEEWNVGR